MITRAKYKKREHALPERGLTLWNFHSFLLHNNAAQCRKRANDRIICDIKSNCAAICVGIAGEEKIPTEKAERNFDSSSRNNSFLFSSISI